MKERKREKEREGERRGETEYKGLQRIQKSTFQMENFMEAGENV